MEEFKGTPGPWFEHREGFSTVYVEARLRQGVIQEVAACGPTEAGSDAQSANARLIAAAPELLAALQRLRDYAEDVCGVCPDDCHKEHPLMVATSVIAKALGK